MRTKTRYYLDTRVLAIVAALAALPLSVGFFLIQGGARASLRNSIGQDFTRLARYAATMVDQAVFREVAHLSEVGGSAILVRAVIESNQRYAPTGDPRDELAKLDRRWWERSPGHPAANTVLTKESSVYLATITSRSSQYHALTLIDAAGAVVAASEKPVHYDIRNNSSFEESIGRYWGDDEFAISDVYRSAEEDTELLNLTVPVLEPVSGKTVGLLHGVVDARMLFRPALDLRFGETGHAHLIHGEGGVVGGGTTECVVGGRYGAFGDFRRAVKEKRPYFVSSLTLSGATEHSDLVGYAWPTVSTSFPQLDWVVVVQQSLAEARAPLATLGRDILAYFLGMGGAVLALAFYMSFTLEKPVTDVKIELHHDLAKPAGSRL